MEMSSNGRNQVLHVPTMRMKRMLTPESVAKQRNKRSIVMLMITQCVHTAMKCTLPLLFDSDSNVKEKYVQCKQWMHTICAGIDDQATLAIIIKFI